MSFMLNEYNTFMKGVDFFDMRLAFYSYPHKFKKQWKYILIHLLDMALFNFCYFLRDWAKNQNTVDYLHYRLQLAKFLIKYDEREEIKIIKLKLREFIMYYLS